MAFTSSPTLIAVFAITYVLLFNQLITCQKRKNGNLPCYGLLDHPCVCTDLVINCTNAHFRSTDVFLQISDSQWPQLDTLVMTGNEFVELEQYLFGPGYTHKNLRLLDLSNNAIQRIDIQAFKNLPRLEHVRLNHNNLSVEPDDERTYQFFHHLERLQILELDAAFNKSASSDDVARTIKYILGPLNKLTKLEYLHLRDNNLTLLNETTFCQLPALIYLKLENNALVNFGGSLINEKCTPSLSELFLDNNRLSRMSRFNFEKFDSEIHLNKISFAQNPFDCNCDLIEFVKWYKQNLYRMLQQNKTTCSKALPIRFKNRPLSELDEESLRCESDEFVDFMHSVYVICGLAIVGLIFLLFCLFYTNRALLTCGYCSFLGGRRGAKKAGLRVTSNGYEILDKEPRIKSEDV